MGRFKTLAILISEGDRDAMLLCADCCRETSPYKALVLYERLGKKKEADEVRSLINVEDDIFG